MRPPYERREIFEAFNKGLSFDPASEFPWFRATLSRSAPRILAENAKVAERVLERIHADGPLSALEFRRRWGWYMLPMLFRDRLVGRIEPRIDRAGGQEQVLGLWWEDGFAPRRTEGFVDAMRDALRAYLHFGGLTRLEWAPHLATERRLFLTRP